MPAIIVTEDALEAATLTAGTDFVVPLAAKGLTHPTHFGCNWVGCPEETAARLSEMPGVSVSSDWSELCKSLGLVRTEQLDGNV